MEVSSQVQFSTSVCRIVPQVQTADHVADCSNPDRVAVIRWKRVSQADVDFISSLDKSTRISVIYRKIFPAAPLRVGHKQTRRAHSTRRMPDRARATKDEVYRAIEALTLGERLKLKHFVAWRCRARTNELWADLRGSAERNESFDFGRCIAASIG